MRPGGRKPGSKKPGGKRPSPTQHKTDQRSTKIQNDAHVRRKLSGAMLSISAGAHAYGSQLCPYTAHPTQAGQSDTLADTPCAPHYHAHVRRKLSAVVPARLGFSCVRTWPTPRGRGRAMLFRTPLRPAR